MGSTMGCLRDGRAADRGRERERGREAAFESPLSRKRIVNNFMSSPAIIYAILLTLCFCCNSWVAPLGCLSRRGRSDTHTHTQSLPTCGKQVWQDVEAKEKCLALNTDDFLPENLNLMLLISCPSLPSPLFYSLLTWECHRLCPFAGGRQARQPACLA